MGDKEEAENDRRKLMNKIFCSALTAVVAGAMLTGCAMPWEKGADDDVALVVIPIRLTQIQNRNKLIAGS